MDKDKTRKISKGNKVEPQQFYTIDLKTIVEEKQRAKEKRHRRHELTDEDDDQKRELMREEELRTQRELARLEKIRRLELAAERERLRRPVEPVIVPSKKISRSVWNKAKKALDRKASGLRVLAKKKVSRRVTDHHITEPDFETWDELMETFPGGIRFFFARLFTVSNKSSSI